VFWSRPKTASTPSEIISNRMCGIWLGIGEGANIIISNAVVEGERSGTPFYQIFCGWNGIPPNIVGVSRNGSAVAFRQMPC